MEDPGDGSFLGEAQLMQESFPPITIFPGGARRLLVSSLDSSTAGKKPHCWNSNPLHFQLLTLSQTPRSRSPVCWLGPWQQGTSPSQKPLLLPNGFKSLLREGKVAIIPEKVHRHYLQRGRCGEPASWAPAVGLVGTATLQQHVPLSLLLFLFW